MLNKVMLIGNLGRDPEIRNTTSGQPVANFSIATNRRWRDRDGNRQEQTEWHNIVCFGRLAEIAGQYLNRGRQIYVEGRLQTSSWEDRQSGEKKYRTEVIADNFQMLGQRGDGGGGGGYGGGGGGGYGGGGGGYGGGGGGYGGGGGGGYGGGQGGGGGYGGGPQGGGGPQDGGGGNGGAQGGGPSDDFGPEPSDDDIPF
ncbi:MAG: single-stranded DNA-binding protein [Acidobacteriota bacterium]